MIRRSYSTLAVTVAVAALILCAPGVGSGQGNARSRQDRCKDGRYTAIIRGAYSGTGTCEVRSDSVLIDANLRDEAGRAGKLVGTFPAKGPYFGGNGTLMRGTGTVRGRLDAARASRLVATFWDDNGRGGRIVAILPTDAGDETWDDPPRE